MTVRTPTEEVTLDQLNQSVIQGYTGNIHVIKLEVPRYYLVKTEPGLLFAFNAIDALADFLLGAKNGTILSIEDNRAVIEVQLASQYLGINLSDLRKVKDAVLITQNPEE